MQGPTENTATPRGSSGPGSTASQGRPARPLDHFLHSWESLGSDALPQSRIIRQFMLQTYQDIMGRPNGS